MASPTLLPGTWCDIMCDIMCDILCDIMYAIFGSYGVFFGYGDCRNVVQVGIPGRQSNNRAHLTSLVAAFKVLILILLFFAMT